jgi:Dimethyladenosine transferase (rRNA methylation)
LIFSQTFYPTPPDLVEKMLGKVNFEDVRNVLEPSAGKGNIALALEEMKNHHFYIEGRRYPVERNYAIDTIEIDENLRHILTGHKLRVIHDDFLTFETFKQYDLIVMNPPFDEGDKHLLKALDILKRGGQVICLLNAETVRNPYTMTRQELMRRIHELGGEVEFHQDAFSAAERKTDVEIALVNVTIPKVKDESIIMDHFRKAQEKAASKGIRKDIVASDRIEMLVTQFNETVTLGLKLLEDYSALEGVLLPSGEYSKPFIEVSVNGGKDHYSVRNKFVEAVRLAYWQMLFESPEITNRMTSNLQEELHRRVDQFADYDFSFFNIFQLLEDLSRRTSKGVEETILKLFDDFLRYALHEGSSNVHYFNGWKANSAHKVGKKVIVPWLRAFSEWDGRFHPDYTVLSRLRDIEKIFDFLDAKRTDHVNLDAVMQKAEDAGQTRKIRTKYFEVSFFKKGTCHLEFLNLELLKKFNLFGSQRKNWLPPSYGKKAYQEMEPEEQAVVDSYEGKASYADVMSDREYFIVPAGGFAMLGAGGETAA